MALTKAQKAVLQEYVANGFNGTKSWLAIHPDTNYQTAASKVSYLLKKQEAQEYITEIQRERLEQLHINAERVLEELSKLAFGSVGTDCSENGKLKAIDLIQKQLGLQNQKIEAKVEETVITVSVNED